MRLFVAFALAVFVALPAFAEAPDSVIRIGVLTDIASSNGDNAGMGSVEAAKMAIEEFGGKIGAHPIDLIFADHQGKPDIGSTIAREWLDTKGVNAIADVPQSAVALAVMPLVQRANAVLLLSGGGASAITGKACSPNTVQWTFNTYALANSTGQAMVADGNKTWYFVSSDYTFGIDLEHQVTDTVLRMGGKVLGAVHAPFNTSDFSSYLLQAQASGAEVVAFANVAADTVNSIKQAHEFGLTQKGQKLAGLLIDANDVRVIGLESAQGLYVTGAFYWDRTDATRAWSARFKQRIGRMPTMIQAGVYSAVHSYLQAVQATGTTAGATVVAQLKRTRVDDMFATNGVVREDGQMVHDMYLMRVKTPAESKSDWDVFDLLHTIPGDQAFQSMAAGGCPLAAKQ
jgi:branched-chain amino acid transport system substrate-binding protein